MAIWLRIIGVMLNAAGAILLAWRMKWILDSMVVAHEAADLNARILMQLLEGRPQGVPLVFGMSEHVAKKQRSSIWLLVIGFGCIAVGNALIAVSWYLDF